MKIEINPDHFATLCICAIRYCHGRETYMPSLVQDIVRAHIKEIPDNDIKVMLDDCDYQKTFNLYGSETIDKPGWLRWKEFLEKEYAKRKEKEK